MPQIFTRETSTFIQWGIPIALLLITLAGWGFHIFQRSSSQTGVGLAPEQDVPFNHQHHIEATGVDCRYCHTSAEVSAHAGFPSTDICMSCHSQIWKDSAVLEPVRESLRSGIPLQWQRVYVLPDFVYFNHSAHVNRDVKCSECHGPVEAMPLTWKFRDFYMKDCLACHRKADPITSHRITRCSACHR
ncbi:MAG TPA: cytochrome C [Bdellovibrionales bacterium]|nr:MAG: hypothetical protein A2Z97_03715 [Bdellovibrionales bacterium GWB1_52_6]OFZ06364.1 MAG: hypothetical protein A2X97_02780 [Bdellovibrionales bacterium GWA1_52_35]OFZ38278.1 MAG: hypothetical protein A2070_13355 [Bdellovibrionales bacterium GWC1_52_8]HAR41645.1 cytochrome C [Bdellovibrionales bacterium]HCM40117.1 cytochrome C [Bdellovibrionales bacterium]